MDSSHCRGLAPALLLLASLSYPQDIPTGWITYHPNQEVRVSSLRPLMARRHEWSDVLLTSLDIAFHDNSVCCGKDSALEDQATSANKLALNEVAAAIQGRHLLSDGRPIQITADYIPGTAANVGYRIINALMSRHALLMVWNSHLYVLYGAVYDEALYSDGTKSDAIRKLLLLDPRFSDSRREVTFNRETDDWGKVQGLLLVSFMSQ